MKPTIDKFYDQTALAEPSDPKAGFRNWINGALGPEFSWPIEALEVENADDDWPIWQDRLNSESRNRIVEGGQRLKDHLKKDSPNLPLVSYITVVRNNAKLLKRTIESVQIQKYPNVEHIVLDGASTDDTIEVIRQHEDTIDYYASEPDDGIYDAINKAVPLARGQFICILNSDDWLEAEAAGVVVRNLMNKPPRALMVSSAIGHDLYGNENIWDPVLVHPGGYLNCANVCHNGIYATRRAYEASGRYDTSYRITADFKWIMRCLDTGITFVYTKEQTVHYSAGGISDDRKANSLECLRVMRDRFPFLSETDAQNLFWCFHSFIDQTGPHIDFTGPAHCMEFLKDISCRHSNRPDFLQAVAWASMATLRHSSDTKLINTSRFVNYLKSLLHSSPRLYNVARRAYNKLK